MDDLEITRRCAEAMGEAHRISYDWDGEPYNPLTDDAQAMALVKRFAVEIYPAIKDYCHAQLMGEPYDLNRAICLAVAQRGKE